MTPRTGTSELRRQVCDALGGSADPRTAQVLQAAVRHLHDFVEEVGLSRAEWQAAIAFLTSVGQRCDQERQEMVLLSDTLGLSMLVEMLNGPSGSSVTEATVLGPFYVAGAPPRPFGGSIVDDPATGGEPLVLGGTVRGEDGAPVGGAVIEVWQVQPSGRYDIEDSPGKRNLRGVFTALKDGRYEIRTVRPVDYTIPDDGPVGELLRATGRTSWRPAHVHLLVTAPGFEPLVTHVFDAGSPWLHADAVFGVRDSIIASMEGGDCRFDVVLGAG